MSIKNYLRTNKHRNKDIIIYDYDTEKKYIITPSNKIYLFNRGNGEKITRKNILNYIRRLCILCEYLQDGAILLQVNY